MTKNKSYAEMINILKPDMPTTQELLPFLKEIDKNGWYTNFGPLENKFRSNVGNLLKKQLGDDNLEITLTSSGTAALQTGIITEGIPPNSTFLIPSFTFPGTVAAVLQSGHRALICDVDGGTGLLTTQIAGRYLNEFDVLLPVGALGQLLPLSEWTKFAKKHNKYLIADCAPSFPYQVPSCTTMYSLHATKPFGVGEGGILAVRSKNNQKNKAITNFGIENSVQQVLGSNFKLSEYHSAVGLSQLLRMEKMFSKRKALFHQIYQASLEDGRYKCLYKQKELAHPSFSFPYYPLIIDENDDVIAFQKHMELQGIETRRWYYPLLYDHPFLRNCSDVIFASNFKGAKIISNRLIGVPLHNHLSTIDCQQIAHAILTFRTTNKTNRVVSI